ncbi:hypothetical protein [Parasediminibacterium sp. JCM 36343]|uniref:hypothetical protein n=1 Tax=Parasediminibacterium sp. JCM 36343 TaxID=3374279 RepID=UPI00397A6868
MQILKKLLLLFIVVIAALSVQAQQAKKKKERKGQFYFSWGYNKEWYTHSNVRVKQSSLDNDYTFKGISGHDHPGWDEGLFHIALSIPQYNYRLGYIFNKKRGLGWEINFDHTKFIFAEQDARLVGKLQGRQVDTTISFREGNGFYYYLNNGANFLLFNLTKRWNFYESANRNVRVDAFGKAGIGPVIPHVQNKLFGQENAQGFQFGGWNMGVEGAVRATFFKSVYLEYAQKLDYARYSNLKVYEGTAKQAFGTYEWILSLGVTFGMGKRE